MMEATSILGPTSEAPLNLELTKSFEEHGSLTSTLALALHQQRVCMQQAWQRTDDNVGGD
jgi:hypothetical protein